jgi:hypothetical protein
MYQQRTLTEVDGKLFLFLGYRAPCYAVIAPCDDKGNEIGPKKRVLREELAQDTFRTLAFAPFRGQVSPALRKIAMARELQKITESVESHTATLLKLPAAQAHSGLRELENALLRHLTVVRGHLPPGLST